MPRLAKKHARLTSALATAVVLFAFAIAGCDSGRKPPGPKIGQQRSASRSDALFASIKSQLASLPERVQLELTPPTVVLDARSSTDGEEVRAVLSRRPGVPTGAPANLIRVPRGNSRFRDAVNSGDTLKYYFVPDEETLARNREGNLDIATFESRDFVVAQVLGEQELLVEGGLPFEVVDPYKIEVWRVSDRRMKQIDGDLAAYLSRRDPPLAWHPSPDQDSIKQLTERLNQWLRQTRVGTGGAGGDWSDPSGLTATLPERLSNAEELKPFLAADALREGYFAEYESRQVQGAIWRRDLARWARGADRGTVASADQLLEWIGRNLQLVDPADAPPRWPWELMLHGQASAAGRAWVLASLCRQLNIGAVVVRAPIEGGDRLLVGVVDGDQLRLFDPVLATPLPSATEGEVASFAELTKSDEPLRALDLPDEPYPLNTASLEQAECFVVATPLELSRRARTLDSRLTGEDAVTLSPSISELAAKVGGITGADSLALWPHPFETLLAKLTAKPPQRRQLVREFLPFAWRPRLWKGRVLQFRGRRGDEAPAANAADAGGDDLRLAAQLFMHRSVRPPDSTLAKVADDKRVIYRRTKTLATLWLGTLHYERDQDAVAAKWLDSDALNNPAAGFVAPLRRFMQGLVADRSLEAAPAAAFFGEVEGPMAASAMLRESELAE